MSTDSEFNVVTGAFSFTSRYIARRLLSSGKQVRTLTNHPDPNSPLAHQIKAFPYNFDHPNKLIEALEGATTLYNSYWIRFPKGDLTYDRAVANTQILIEAAERAGVRRIVHLSVANASEESHLPYFRGKGQVEKLIMDSGLPYAILRPTLIFGIEDILINNTAWFLRRFPLFPIGGSGDYPVQPVFVGDVAEQAVNAAGEAHNIIVDSAGPEVFTYDEMVRLIADKIGSKARVVHMSPGLALFLSRVVGYALRDVVLTRYELDGLMAGLLVTNEHPTGQTKLGEWLEANADQLGADYTSELRRHYS